MNAKEWVDRLQRNETVNVVQFSPAECGEMARLWGAALQREERVCADLMRLRDEIETLRTTRAHPTPVAHAGSPSVVDDLEGLARHEVDDPRITTSTPAVTVSKCIWCWPIPCACPQEAKP